MFSLNSVHFRSACNPLLIGSESPMDVIKVVVILTLDVQDEADKTYDRNSAILLRVFTDGA